MKKFWSIVLLLMSLALASASWAAQETAVLKRADGEGACVQRQAEHGVPLTKGGSYTVRLLSERESSSHFDSSMILSFEGEDGGKFLFDLGEIAGYDAAFKTASFVDGDKAEIFLSTASGGSGGYGMYYVIEFDGVSARVIYDSDRDPLPSHITGKFMDGYKCIVRTHGEADNAVIDLSPRKALYDGATVYNPAGGKLLKSVELWGGSYGSMAPTRHKKDGTCALRGTVAYSGLFNADRILSVTITQVYEKGRWRPAAYDIKPWNDLKIM